MRKILYGFKKITFFHDLSFSAFFAGFTTVLVGVTSSIIIVFQAATAVGASPSEITSWIWALGLSLGLLSIILSLYYKIPLVTAWSTPGAAYIALNSEGIDLHHAVGAFIMTGVLISILGFSSLFKKLIDYIPTSITSAMLAGVLLPFCFKIFDYYPSNHLLILGMVVSYFFSKKLFPKYSVFITLVIGGMIAGFQGTIKYESFSFNFATPIFIEPAFSIHSIVQITIPLLIITMVSQNLIGVSIIKSFGYQCPVNQSIGWTGVLNTVFAPFGGFSANLAAISASLCLNDEVHQNQLKRYTASVIAGFFYVLVGIFGSAITYLFLSFPKALIIALASLALLPTLVSSLLDAFKDKKYLDSATLTFIITVSSISVGGLSSIILGLISGLALYIFELRVKRRYE